jgi:Apea-like HEPN
MPRVAPQPLAESLRQSFTDTLAESLRGFSELSPGQSEENKLHIALHNTLNEPAQFILRIDVVKRLSETAEFRSLLDLVWRDEVLKRRFIGRLAGSHVENSEGMHLAKALLLRALAEIRYDPDDRPPARMMNDFINFLDDPLVERHVHVSLVNVEMPQEVFAIHGLGAIRGFEAVESQDFRGWTPQPPVDLMFSVRTPHFLGIFDVPIASHVDARIALMRLAVYPLIACYDVHVQCIRPWEDPFPGPSDWDRYRAGRLEKTWLPCRKIEWKNLEDVETLQAKFVNLPWDRLTPWRLAIDRLANGVVKLESKHQDAILDFAIGLESLYLEPESRQEATHKIATRAAKYLAQEKTERLSIYRMVKDIYKARSALAHGQPLDLDEKTLRQATSASTLLAWTLKQMTRNRVTRLDLTELDLG